MIKNINDNQSGIAHLLILVVLGLSLIIGVYLVGQQTVFRSKANTETGITITGQKVNEGKTSSGLVIIKPFYKSDDSNNQPTSFRLANSATLIDQGKSYPFNQDTKQNGVVWSLSSGTGEKIITVQFGREVNGETEWENSIYDAKIQRLIGDNKAVLGAVCTKTDNPSGPYEVKLLWAQPFLADIRAKYMYFQTYSDNGENISTYNSFINSSEAKIYVPSRILTYNLYATAYTPKISDAIEDAEIYDRSEISFSCLDNAPAAALISPANFPTNGTPYCEVKVSDVDGYIKRVDYAGINGPVRLAVSTKDLVTEIPGSRISVDGRSTIRDYDLDFEPYGKVYSYILDTCDGKSAKGCSGTVANLDLPVGSYNVYCDVIKDEQTSCSGYGGCQAEGGQINCQQKWNRPSCSNQDNASVSVDSKGVCRQSLAYAKNLKSGECRTFSTSCAIPAGWLPTSSCTKEANAATILFPTNSNIGLDISCDMTNNKITVSGKKVSQLLRFGEYYEYPNTGNPQNDTNNAKYNYTSLPVGANETTYVYSTTGAAKSIINTYFVEIGTDDSTVNNFTVKTYANFRCEAK